MIRLTETLQVKAIISPTRPATRTSDGRKSLTCPNPGIMRADLGFQVTGTTAFYRALPGSGGTETEQIRSRAPPG